MASQQRLTQRCDPPHAKPSDLGPIVHRQRLLRLILVTAITGSVVSFWSLSLRDTDDQLATVGSVRITSPPPEIRRTGTGALGVVNTEPEIALRPDTLPRPPEPPDPALPNRFERFIVQPSDTIYDISIVYGVSIDEILLFNPDLGNGSHVDVGQIVIVPIFEP